MNLIPLPKLNIEIKPSLLEFYLAFLKASEIFGQLVGWFMAEDCKMEFL